MTGEGSGGRGEHWDRHWKRHEAVLRRQRVECAEELALSHGLPHVHAVDIVGSWEEKDGVERKVGHRAHCACTGCGWSAEPRTGELEVARAAAKADRDEHQRHVLGAQRADRDDHKEDRGCP